MRTFLCSSDKNFGACTHKIYRIKNNQLIYLGENKVNTASMRGFDHETGIWLVKNKYIPKTWLTDAGYIDYKKYRSLYGDITLLF